MQFKREMADLVLAGKKTQTRRVRPARHKVGSIQPVQCGYRDKARGHIRILRIKYQALRNVTQAEVEAEGFESIGAFWEYIIKINEWAKRSRGSVMNTVLTVYEFELVEKDLS